MTQAPEELGNQRRREFMRQMFPGGPAIWAVGIALAAGVAWYRTTPKSAPACDDAATVGAINRMFLMANIEVATTTPMPRRNTDPVSAPKIASAREVGFAKVTNTRGCVASFAARPDSDRFAFTIQPASSPQHEAGLGAFVIVGADAHIVEARFGSLTPEGGYAHQAEPIGRDRLEAALRAGVEAFNTSAGPSRKRLLEQAKSPATRLVETAPERTREIADVEPLGPCTQVGTSQRYACRMLIERNDPLLASLGSHGSITFEAEFVFERDGADDTTWRVTSEFANDYATAYATSRRPGR